MIETSFDCVTEIILRSQDYAISSKSFIHDPDPQTWLPKRWIYQGLAKKCPRCGIIAHYYGCQNKNKPKEVVCPSCLKRFKIAIDMGSKKWGT